MLERKTVLHSTNNLKAQISRLLVTAASKLQANDWSTYIDRLNEQSL